MAAVEREAVTPITLYNGFTTEGHIKLFAGQNLNVVSGADQRGAFLGGGSKIIFYYIIIFVCHSLTVVCFLVCMLWTLRLFEYIGRSATAKCIKSYISGADLMG
jgi:hypothetical protein